MRALRALGASVLRLPAQSINANATFDWPAALAHRVDVDGWIFTSPAAVRHAQPLLLAGFGTSRSPVFAVGSGTARALRRHGVSVQAPSVRQDSEGLLALPLLAEAALRRVVVVTAPGGRGLIVDTLRERGTLVETWPVYQRQLVNWSSRSLRRIANASSPLLTLLSSDEALQHLATALPAPIWQHLAAGDWVASSDRLADRLREQGIASITVAASATAADLVHAALATRKR